MAPPDKRPPPLPGKPILDQQPERGAVRMPRAEPPKRTQTLPGIPTVALPAEPALAPTLPAPNPLQKKTWRVPTPPSAAALARRSDPPTGTESSKPPSPTMGQPDASAELAEARAKLAEYERRERVQVESRGPGPYQAPIRSPSPVPSSTPEAKADRAIGGLVRAILARFGWPALAALGIGGAALKPTADPAKADATLASVQAMQADVALLREQMVGMLKREAARDQYVRCLEESLDEVGEQLLPAQDRISNASPLRAYVKRCQRLRP